MKTPAPRSSFFNPLLLTNFAFCSIGVLLALHAFTTVLAQGPGQNEKEGGLQATVATLVPTTATLVNESCLPGNGVIDPRETVTIAFGVQNTGGANTANLVATLQATGGVLMSPGAPQNYGVVVAGGPSVSRNFTFTASPGLLCGSEITATLQLQDGAANLGNVTYTLRTGTNTIYTENFDGVTAPVLPAGYTSDTSFFFGMPWTTTTFLADSGPNCAFGPEPTGAGETNLNSPVIAIPAIGALQLQFRHEYNLENGFDGEVLEIKIGAGAFQDILAAGGSFVSGGYNDTLNHSGGTGNPLYGRMAWTGLSGGNPTFPAYITSVVNLPAAAAGQNIQLRWRIGSDDRFIAAGYPGVRIDTIRISSGYRVCSTNCPNQRPTITTDPFSPIIRQQGTAAGNSTIIATVNDDSGAFAVTVTVTSANPSNGVTISNIVNTNGTVTADIVTGCTATNAPFTLQASDGSLTANATLNVDVTANTPPTLTYNNPAAITTGDAATVTPATGLSDNGSIQTAIQSQGTYTGTISVDSSGVVSISEAAPLGTHTITIRATDNCGAFTDASFTLQVIAPRNLSVTKTADTNDGVCDADCSLREALGAAGSDGVGDLITFNIPANSAGCVGNDCTITLSSTLNPAADGGRLTTINGYTGPNTITISANNVAQILNLGAGVNLSASNLNLTGSNGNNGNGAITIASGATMTLSNCTLFNNMNNSPGGALKNAGLLNLINVTVSGNQSSNGGGINNTGTVTATNCTFTINSGGFGGGGVTNNGTFNIRNTIIAGNSSALANYADALGSFTSQGHNLIGNADGSSGFTTVGDQTGTAALPLNPLLTALGNNGGPTRTHALQAGSPAINVGDSLAPLTDQRGWSRNGIPDKGAYEFNGIRPPVSVTTVRSRKTHGSAGTFDIPLPISGNPGVESRSGGATNAHTIIVTFSNPLSSVGDADVTSGFGAVASTAIGSDAHDYLVNLTGVTDAQQITLTLSNVTDSLGFNSNAIATSIGFLLGDANGDGTVNSADATQTRSRSGQALDGTNFRSDVNADGFLNSADVTIVRARSGNALP